MPKRIPRRRPSVHASRPKAPAVPTVKALRRQVARLTTELQAVEVRHRRQVAALRRAADRRMAALVQEIAALRHHEARAEALARILTEREGGTAGKSASSRLSPESTSPPSG